MGVLPVPEEVRDMADNIRKLAEAVKDQSKILELMRADLADVKGAMKGSEGLGPKLDAIHSTLTTSRDTLRMLSTFMERKI